MSQPKILLVSLPCGPNVNVISSHSLTFRETSNMTGERLRLHRTDDLFLKLFFKTFYLAFFSYIIPLADCLMELQNSWKSGDSIVCLG